MGNNRDLPTYEKSVALQVTQQPDPSGAANMMINSFRNFSETASVLSQGISKEVATQERETLRTNISNTYRGFALEALNNPNQTEALVNFNESSKNYAAGLMQQTNKFNRPYVSNLVDYYSNEHRFSIEKNSIMQNRREASVNAYKNLNDGLRDVYDAVNNSKPMIDENGEDHQFDASRALLADTLRTAEQNSKVAGIDPAVFGKGRDQIIKNYVTEEYLKRYQDAVEEGHGDEFISKIRDPKFNIPGISIDEKRIIIDKMDKIRGQGRSGARIVIGQLKDQMSKELINVGRFGQQPNQELQAQIDAVDHIKGAEFKEQIEIKQAEYAAREAVTYKTPAEKKAYIDHLKEIDPKDPDAAKKYRIAKASEAAIAAQDQEMRKDPLQFVMKDPAIKDAVNNYEQAFNADATGSQLKYTPFNSSVEKPWNSVIDAQMRLGFTLNGKNENSVRLIDPARVNTMVNEAMMADSHDKIVYMNKLSEEYGGGLPFKLVLKQMVNAGLPRNYAMLATLDPNSPDALNVAEAVSLPAADIKEALDKKFPASSGQPSASGFIAKGAINAVFNQNLEGTNNFKALLSTLARYDDQFNIEFKNNMASDIMQIANYIALTQNKTATQALESAQDIIASRYNYTTLYNSPIRIPKDIPEKAVKDYADKMQENMGSFQFNFEGLSPANKERATYALSHGHWKNDAVDNGLVWVDSNEKMWTDKNGQPYTFSFEDAKAGADTHGLFKTAVNIIKGMPSIFVQNSVVPPTAKKGVSEVKKLQSPLKQQEVETGIDLGGGGFEEDEIDKAGKQELKSGKVQGLKFRALMQSVNQDNK